MTESGPAFRGYPNGSFELDAPNSFGFADAVAIAMRNLRLLIAVVAVGTFATYVGTLFLEDRYAARTTIVLARSEPEVFETDGTMELQLRDRAAVETEIDIIHSRSFAGLVVDRLHLIESKSFNPYLRGDDGPLHRFREVLATLFGADENGSSASGAFSAQASEASSTPQGSSGNDAAAWESSPIPGSALPPVHAQRAAAITKLLSALTVSRGKGESLAITVQIVGPDAPETARVANGLSEIYTEESLENKRAATRNVISSLNAQADELAVEIAEAERVIASFGEPSDLTGNADINLLDAQLVEINLQLTRARVELKEQEARLSQMTALMENESAGAEAILTSTMLASLRSDMARLERERSELGLVYAEKHPQMQNKVAEIRSVRRAIDEEIQRILIEYGNQVEIARVKVKELASELRALEDQHKKRELSTVDGRLLERKVAAKRQRHQEILRRLGELERQVQVLSPNARVVSAAEVPAEPFFPRPGLIIAGGFAGSLALSFLGVLLRESVDNKVRSGSALQRRYPIRFFGYVPVMPPAARKPGRLLEYIRRDPHSMLSEWVRSILWRSRPARSAATDGQPGRVVMLTSAAPGDGKSSLSVALAAVSAETGRSTLLIDFDLRRRGATRLLGNTMPSRKPVQPPGSSTLQEFLRGEATHASLLKTHPKLPSLRVMSMADDELRGNSIFYSRHLTSMFAAARQRFDLVIVDTPPALIVNDAVELAQHCDAVILVARWGRTSEAEIGACLARFEERDPGTIGLVINGVRHDRHRYYEAGGNSAAYTQYAGTYLRS